LTQTGNKYSNLQKKEKIMSSVNFSVLRKNLGSFDPAIRLRTLAEARKLKGTNEIYSLLKLLASQVTRHWWDDISVCLEFLQFLQSSSSPPILLLHLSQRTRDYVTELQQRWKWLNSKIAEKNENLRKQARIPTISSFSTSFSFSSPQPSVSKRNYREISSLVPTTDNTTETTSVSGVDGKKKQKISAQPTEPQTLAPPLIKKRHMDLIVDSSNVGSNVAQKAIPVLTSPEIQNKSKKSAMDVDPSAICVLSHSTMAPKINRSVAAKINRHNRVASVMNIIAKSATADTATKISTDTIINTATNTAVNSATNTSTAHAVLDLQAKKKQIPQRFEQNPLLPVNVAEECRWELWAIARGVTKYTLPCTTIERSKNSLLNWNQLNDEGNGPRDKTAKHKMNMFLDAPDFPYIRWRSSEYNETNKFLPKTMPLQRLQIADVLSCSGVLTCKGVFFITGSVFEKLSERCKKLWSGVNQGSGTTPIPGTSLRIVAAFPSLDTEEGNKKHRSIIKFPSIFEMKINGKMIPRLVEEENYNFGQLFGLDISSHVARGRNTLELFIAPPFSLHLQFSLRFIDYVSDSELFEQIIAGQTRSQSECLDHWRNAVISRTLENNSILGLSTENDDNDRDDGARNQLTPAGTEKQENIGAEASVLDPYSMICMNTPVRSVHCRPHAQCFDLHSHITANRATPSFRCPCCGAVAALDDLYQDTLCKRALEKYHFLQQEIQTRRAEQRNQKLQTYDNGCEDITSNTIHAPRNNNNNAKNNNEEKEHGYKEAMSSEDDDEDEEDGPSTQYFISSQGIIHFANH
jgi:hypothetical protein